MRQFNTKYNKVASAMLVHEAINKFGKTVEIEIGEPLTWERLADRGGRQQLTDYLYQQVQSLRN